MGMNVSGFVWHRLRDRGIVRVYGYPGDGVGGLDEALQKVIETLHYVQVRHEEAAAFMATAYAKATGRIGVCLATSGPGGIHLLNGLYDAALNEFTGTGNFSLNANAGLTIVNYSALGQSNVGKGDIVVWSNTSGGFIGANVSGTRIAPNTAEDQSYYGKQTSTRQIISGEVGNASADQLRDELPA